MKFLTALCLSVSALYCVLFPEQSSVSAPESYSIQEAPVQSQASSHEFDFKGYKIIPLADISLKGRVLSYKKYSGDKEADLSPIDLALGWGPMSENKVLARIDISQRNRWYFWKTDKFPIPRNEIENNSANMHIIPSSDLIAEQISNIKRNQIVSIQGHLVKCTQDSWKWKSSLTRSDTGNGACEVIYVKSLNIENP
ncbi:MAG: hypothetical protein NE328_10005 [Lentisphaeraceae bacterium]|nr:hypothetical protein [Lentisphaeraceae bacterium]